MRSAIHLIKKGRQKLYSFVTTTIKCHYHNSPFLDLYRRVTSEMLDEYYILKLQKKHPNILNLTYDRLQYSLKILEKFNITTFEACNDPHVFCMNPITLDNYGEILKECGFKNISTTVIIKYHTFMKSKTLAYLKTKGLISDNNKLEETLLDLFPEWPSIDKPSYNFMDSNTSILTVRMYILKKYLNWRLGVTEDEFNKYCRNYLPLKHKPMSDIKEAINIAENKINFSPEEIRSNGFIISSDPINTKLIIENVKSLAGLDIKDVIKMQPAILKNNYNSLIQIRNILEEYNISEDAQRRNLRIYCMCSQTVQERFNELRQLKEYNVLSTNPRVLSLVIHKRKMMTRLNKMEEVKKECYSFNHLVTARKVFNAYIGSFGSKGCGRDIAVLITSSLNLTSSQDTNNHSEVMKKILVQLKRHKYWLHVALNVIDDNLHYLKKRFSNDVILQNCHLLLYPPLEIEQYLELLLNYRENKAKAGYNKMLLDTNFHILDHKVLNDNQILSLILYEIEKKHHFSGDGIWSKQEGLKVDVRVSR